VFSVRFEIKFRKLTVGEADFCGEHEPELSFSNPKALHEYLMRSKVVELQLGEFTASVLSCNSVLHTALYPSQSSKSYF
jgi:hypothetical protein